MDLDTEEIRQEILSLTKKRGPGSSICPSEVARSLGDDGWRDLMEPVREIAEELSNENKIQITQNGQPVQLENVSGPIRLTINASNTNS